MLQNPISVKSKWVEHVSLFKFESTPCEIALEWMTQNTFDDKSILIQVMVWCLMVPSHYLS